MTIFLRTENRAEMNDALVIAGIITISEEGEILVTQNYHFDEIGKIYKPTGEFEVIDVGGDPMRVPVSAVVPGWHVNILGDLTEDQVEALPILDPPPLTPERVFA